MYLKISNALSATLPDSILNRDYDHVCQQQW